MLFWTRKWGDIQENDEYILPGHHTGTWLITSPPPPQKRGENTTWQTPSLEHRLILFFLNMTHTHVSRSPCTRLGARAKQYQLCACLWIDVLGFYSIKGHRGNNEAIFLCLIGLTKPTLMASQLDMISVLIMRNVTKSLRGKCAAHKVLSIRWRIQPP